jgi:general secretion pathway protein M
MIGMERLQSMLARFPLAALALYLGLIVVFVSMTMGGVLDVLERRAAVVSALDILDRIESRDPARPRAAPADVAVPAGSPFLEGASSSVAGAALLQRVAGITRQMRGNILSSQVDLAGPQSKTGFITATMSFEIEQASLQPLLYDLEAGMPFLFVEQLIVQAPSAAGDGGKLRVLLAISGQWRGAK